MRLNTIKPAEGSKKEARRVGRGIGSTLGKTCGRGHKGSYARTGKGKIKPGCKIIRKTISPMTPAHPRVSSTKTAKTGEARSECIISRSKCIIIKPPDR